MLTFSKTLSNGKAQFHINYKSYFMDAINRVLQIPLLTMNNEPNLATPIAAGCTSTWGDKKALCEIEAKSAYERGETFSDNPYIENTWAHKWWERTLSECTGHYKNINQYTLPLM